MLTQDHKVYQLKNFEISMKRSFKFAFPKETPTAPDRMVVQVEYCPEFELLILLNNANELVIAERLNL